MSEWVLECGVCRWVFDLCIAGVGVGVCQVIVKCSFA